MYRFLVFAYDQHYPGGGMDDCELKANDSLEVKEKVKLLLFDKNYEFVEVYDTKEDVIYSIKNLELDDEPIENKFKNFVETFGK